MAKFFLRLAMGIHEDKFSLKIGRSKQILKSSTFKYHLPYTVFDHLVDNPCDFICNYLLTIVKGLNTKFFNKT